MGNIFQLGDKYSQAMNATVLDENGANQVMTMGCYGIGVSRVVAAAIEQNHDDNGITWPQAIAPFDIALAPINMQKSERLQAAADRNIRRFGLLEPDRGETGPSGPELLQALAESEHGAQ